MIEAHPLSWPIGYKRTSAGQRSNSKFSQNAEKAQQFLRNELTRLGGRNLVVSTNVPVRKDGYIYVDMASTLIDDPGVAIYFKYKGKDISMCCDTYRRVWENIYALGKGIEALRGMERWGVSEFLDRAFTGFKALPDAIGGNDHLWFNVLGVSENATAEEIKNAYRNKVKIHHPDNGGSVASFQLIQRAYEQGINKFSLTT